MSNRRRLKPEGRRPRRRKAKVRPFRQLKSGKDYVLLGRVGVKFGINRVL
jgi:hypothetical protein